jgi:transcriptional regulator with XRE-family HTH domain
MLLRWGKQVGNPIPSRRSKVREIDRRYAQEAERPGIGYLLEQARVNRGVSLEEAAQATRIRRDYLEKLESDDHSTMPEPIYVRGFIKTYAKRGFIKTYANYLGLDGDRLAAQIRFWQERRRRARRRPLWDL